MNWRSIIICAALFSFTYIGKAQNIAIKTNVLWDVVSNISLGGEIGIAPQWSVDVSGSFNNWDRSHGRRWKHMLVQPELRYWFCERFGGHFVGLHVHGGKYNISNIGAGIKLFGTDFDKLSGKRYQGWFAGLGIGYGYDVIVGKHWNLEAELGLGYSYTRYDRYPCAWCGVKEVEDKAHHYLGPTKVALNLVYIF